MGLSHRKETILQAVVDSYIVGCEPISSAEIQRQYLPELSSATIRNELSALEEMGYLEQPHTSAGRVPTAEAYKLYVDRLMPKRKLTRAELKTVKRYFNRKITEIDEILKNTAKVISEITNLTGVAVIPNLRDAVIRSIKLVKVTEDRALVIIVTDSGILKDATVEVNPELSDGYFFTAGNFITAAYAGHAISEIIKPKALIKQIKNEYEQLFDAILMVIKHYAEDGPADVLLEGSAKILAQPEYANVDKAKVMLEMLEAKERLAPMLTGDDSLAFNIHINKANEMGEGSPECAIVSASYSIGGVQIGNAGVIGPIRMDYSKVVSVLDCIGKTINVLPDEVDDEE